MDIDEELTNAVAEYRAAKSVEELAIQRRQDAQDHVATLLEALGNKTRSVEILGVPYRVTRSSAPYVKSVDEKGLKKAVGAKVWRRITDVKFSKAKLEVAIDEGLVDAQTAARFIQIENKKPSITVTEIKED